MWLPSPAECLRPGPAPLVGIAPLALLQSSRPRFSWPRRVSYLRLRQFVTVLEKQMAEGGQLASVVTEASSFFGFLNPTNWFRAVASGSPAVPAAPQAQAWSPQDAATAWRKRRVAMGHGGGAGAAKVAALGAAGVEATRALKAAGW